MKTEELEERAAQALTETLKEIPFLQVHEAQRERDLDSGRADWVIEAEIAGRQMKLIIEFKRSGEPRLVREVADGRWRYTAGSPNSYLVFAAPYISPSAAQVCREAGIGYLDLSGNCRLTFDNIYLEREGRPNAFAEKRDLRTLYSPKAARVLRVLLNDVRQEWKLQALADEAGVSLGQAHKVKALLADREWISSTQEGIRLSKPAELLAEWARNYSHRKDRAYQYYILETPGKAEDGLTAACSRLGIRYALAAFSAAARHAPFVRYQRAYAYVQEGGIEELVKSLRLKEAPSGANLVLWVPYDDGVWYGTREFAGTEVTSDIQTYLDLQSMHERGDEAARFLLEQEIKPRW